MKKQPYFSLQKVMRHLSNPRDYLLDGYEGEMHQELSGKSAFNRPNAVLIPLTVKAYVDYATRPAIWIFQRNPATPRPFGLARMATIPLQNRPRFSLPWKCALNLSQH
jgi:hypothetical protein